MVSAANDQHERQRVGPPFSSPAGDFTAATLFLGVIGYGLLCGPAITQRGYPPLDPFWTAMAFLWPAPLLLTSIFDTRPLGQRKWAVTLYCLVAAFLASGTLPTVVPHTDNVGAMLLGTVVLGPCFLLFGFALEVSMQVAHLGQRPPFAVTWRSWSRRIVAGVLIIGSVATPFVFHTGYLHHVHNRARRRAEEDWSKHDAMVYESNNIRVKGQYSFGVEADPASGFPTHVAFSNLGFAEAYNERIRELLAEKGLPPWSLKADLPTDQELVALLDDKSLVEVTSYPAEVTDSIAIISGGRYERWGSTSITNGIGIVTRQGSLVGLGGDSARMFTGQIPGHPDVVVIRQGSNWVGMFHKDGRRLASVSRDAASAPAARKVPSP